MHFKRPYSELFPSLPTQEEDGFTLSEWDNDNKESEALTGSEDTDKPCVENLFYRVK